MSPPRTCHPDPHQGHTQSRRRDIVRGDALSWLVDPVEFHDVRRVAQHAFVLHPLDRCLLPALRQFVGLDCARRSQALLQKRLVRVVRDDCRAFGGRLGGDCPIFRVALAPFEQGLQHRA